MSDTRGADLLNAFIESLDKLPEDERNDLVNEVYQATEEQTYVPNPGPQSDAWFSDADELFYGGQAGGGKSSLGCGIAFENHRRALILRRIRGDAGKLAEDELLGAILRGDRKGWNGSDLVYRDRYKGKQIRFGGCEQETDKFRFQGDPWDLMVFDEITNFLASQYLFITIWNRSAVQGQRVRVICTGNPPTRPEGLWVIQHWAPWLDPRYPNPAKPGELRWFVQNEAGNGFNEVGGPGPHLVGNRMVRARSRTFIPAALADNPDLSADGVYAARLDSLSKELRDAYRDGQFNYTLQDNPFQCIKAHWVAEAQDRWIDSGGKSPEGVPMCSLGADVAQGGADENVFAPRYGHWYADLTVVPGSETPLGTSQAGLITSVRRDGAIVVIDCGGGYGNTAYRDLKVNEPRMGNSRVVAYVGSKTDVTSKSKDGLLGFANKRTEAYWRFGEALDPSQPGGSDIALPLDPVLVSDLCAPTYDVRNGVIHLEAKAALTARLGRSPDRGDAVVMAWAYGEKIENIPSGGDWGDGRGRAPRVISAPPGNSTSRRKRYSGR